MKQIIKIIFVLSIGIALAIWLAVSRTEVEIPPKDTPPAPQVSIIVASPSPQISEVSLLGEVMANRSIEIVAGVTGRIRQVADRWVTGSYFKQGQLLLTIDDLDYLNAQAQAQANLAQALEQLALEAGRGREAQQQWHDLKNSQANDLFLRKPQQQRAQAMVDAAQNALEYAKSNVQKTKILAPFDGYIGSINSHVGKYIATPSTKLLTFYQIDPLRLSVALDNKQLSTLDINDFRRHKHIKVVVSKSIGDQKVTRQGRVLSLSHQIDSNDRLYRMNIEVVNNEYPQLLPGMFVDVRLQGTKLRMQVTLPVKALFHGNRVLVVDKNNRLQSKHVELLWHNGNEIRVSGIDNGDKIVTQRPSWVHEGSLVTTKLPTTP